jgi:hypothetical protein
MKKMTALLATIVGPALCTVLLAAQDPSALKPGPEQKNLARFAGTWKMEGTMETSPLGPGGKMTGTEKCTMFEGGWHLVCDSKGKAPMGELTGHAIMTYDRNAKQYRYFSVNNMADAEMATGTLSGNTWTWTSTMDQGGQKLHSRFVIVEKSPTVHTFSWEMSMDGKTWKSMMNGTSTKAP